MHVKHNANENGQIFMVEEVKPGSYEIVNCLSGLVFDEEKKEIRLKKGKQSKDQLFVLEEAQVQALHKYYWIKTSEKGDKALFLEGILRYGDFDPKNQAQMFRFEHVKINQMINNSSVLVNNYSGKVLDVPGNSHNPGEKIIQWERNLRWNQRWTFVKSGKGYLIKNLSTGHCLDISG